MKQFQCIFHEIAVNGMPPSNCILPHFSLILLSQICKLETEFMLLILPIFQEFRRTVAIFLVS